MEPRTHARGNDLNRHHSPASGNELQWSHALTRVETALVPNSAKTIVTVALASASLAHPIILPLECTCSKLSPTY